LGVSSGISHVQAAPLLTALASRAFRVNLNQILRSRQLVKGYLEMVGIVEGIEEDIFVELVDILEAGKPI